MNMEHDPNQHGPGRFRFNWVLIGFLIIAGYFLIAEHKAHLSGYLYYLPYLLLLACPFLHMFMHGGHGDHGSSGGHQHSSTQEKRDKSGGGHQHPPTQDKGDQK